MITFHFDIISKTTPEMPTLIVLRRSKEFDKLNLNDKIYNKFDFNLLHYNLINRINYKKEIFIWTVNNKKIFKKINNKLKNYSNIYVISDVPYLLK